MSARPLSRAPLCAALACLALCLAAAQPAWGFRVVTYNLLNYDAGERQAYFRTVMDSLDADIVVVQEVNDNQQDVNDFLNNVLNHAVPNEYRAMPFSNGPDTDNACFYKGSSVDSIAHQQIFTPTRHTSEYVFRPDGYASSAAEFRILSTHLKAGSSSSDETARLAMTNVIRDYLNGLPSGSNFMVVGDMNVYTNLDTGYQRLVRSETDNDGRTKDPINKQGVWSDNYTYRMTHTQSSRVVDIGDGGSTGGMDDRFDQILISYALDDGSELSYVANSYFAFGNDSNHLNAAVNAQPNTVVGVAVANALYHASDHLPVACSFQVPAKISSPTSIAFGSYIVGATAERTLTVTNGAATPADELSYSLAAPSGFTAPGGTFVANAGAGNNHTISMNTASAADRSGQLAVSSNDVDHATWNVALSGTVLAHAVPSLSGSASVLLDTLDFGSHVVGEFTDLPLNAYNRGYVTLQALLEVYDHTLVGGDGRFDFVGGFAAKEAGASPAAYTIGFDADGAADDSLYTAVLTLKTRDDTAVSGGTNLSDLVIYLSAYVQGGSGVPDDVLTAIALGSARPNPFTGGTALSLSLPGAADVTVEIHDVAGRVVRTLVSGPMSAGVHEIAWDGKDDRGEGVASGVYFCHAEVGAWRDARKLVLLR